MAEPVPGNCFRCGGYGHWAADSPACPWMRKAPTEAAHMARIERFRRRFLDFEISRHQKTDFINQENAIWRAKGSTA